MKNLIALCLILWNINLYGQDQMRGKLSMINPDENNNSSISWYMGAAMLNVFVIGDLAENSKKNSKTDFVDTDYDILISPTPISKELNICVNAKTRKRKINSNVFSLRESRTVVEKATREQNINLDMLALSTGKYLIRWSDASNKTLML